MLLLSPVHLDQELRTKGDMVLINLISPGQQSLQAFGYLVQCKPALLPIFWAAGILYSSVMCL